MTNTTSKPVTMNYQDIHTLIGAYVSDYRDHQISTAKNLPLIRSFSGYPSHETIVAWHVALVTLPRDEHQLILPFKADNVLTGIAQYFSYNNDKLLQEGYYLSTLDESFVSSQQPSVKFLLKDLKEKPLVVDNSAPTVFPTIKDDFIIAMEEVARRQMDRTAKITLNHGDTDKALTTQHEATGEHAAISRKKYFQEIKENAFSSFVKTQKGTCNENAPRKNILQRVLGL